MASDKNMTKIEEEVRKHQEKRDATRQREMTARKKWLTASETNYAHLEQWVATGEIKYGNF